MRNLSSAVEYLSHFSLLFHKGKRRESGAEFNDGFCGESCTFHNAHLSQNAV